MMDHWSRLIFGICFRYASGLLRMLRPTNKHLRCSQLSNRLYDLGLASTSVTILICTDVDQSSWPVYPMAHVKKWGDFSNFTRSSGAPITSLSQEALRLFRPEENMVSKALCWEVRREGHRLDLETSSDRKTVIIWIAYFFLQMSMSRNHIYIYILSRYTQLYIWHLYTIKVYIYIYIWHRQMA